MKALLQKKSLLLTLALLAMAFGAGCAATDDQNLSERPWNAPKSWETGIPQAMQQGR